MKICLLLSTFAYDGIKRSVVHFANAMHELNHEVWVGVLHDWPGKVSLQSELQIPKDQIVSWEGLGQGKREWSMYRFFRQHRFDVVHCNTVKMNHLGRWIALWAGIPCIIASEDNLCLKRSWKTRLEDRILAGLGSAVVMISEGVAQSFLEVEKLPKEKIHVVYYGVPLALLEKSRRSPNELNGIRQKLGIPAGPTVVCAARLHFSKSIDTLIHSAKNVLQQLPQVQWIIAGDGDELSRLKTLRDQLNLQAHIHFIGARDDIYDILQLGDVTVLCSLWEGLGYSLMEAMAFEKPVIGTSVSGINEIIEDQKNGLLVPSESAEKLAQATLNLLTHPAAAQSMGKEGRRILSEKFDIQKNTQKLLEIYRSCLNSKSASNN